MDINEIQREVNNNQCYINPFKSRVYLKFLLSRVKELEKAIEKIYEYSSADTPEINQVVRNILGIK